ncbi:hypothetical protein ACFVQ4_34190 [Streptomyces laurentii]|uniref:DinB/UmuC family translesion DNA polymerase n=1 Tax=Streptomyces laurentii TaxID=39478 RepID=UPI0036AF3E04
MDESIVCRILGGKAGRPLSDRACGIDPRTMAAGRLPQSTSASNAFDVDTIDSVRVRAALLDLVVTLAGLIRGRGQTARTMVLTVRLAGGARVQRTRALPAPSTHTDDLPTATFRILNSMAFQRARIRHFTLTADGLRPADEGPAPRSPSAGPGRQAPPEVNGRDLHPPSACLEPGGSQTTRRRGARRIPGPASNHRPLPRRHRAMHPAGRVVPRRHRRNPRPRHRLPMPPGVTQR